MDCYSRAVFLGERFDEELRIVCDDMTSCCFHTRVRRPTITLDANTQATDTKSLRILYGLMLRL
jgi:hypothetical protein